MRSGQAGAARAPGARALHASSHATTPLAVVTGANRGIGLALTSLLKQRGYEVVGRLPQQRSSPALRALTVTIVEGVDVADQTT